MNRIVTCVSLILSAMFVVTACQNEQPYTDNIIQTAYAPNSSSPMYSNIVDSIAFIPLETTEKSLLGDIKQLIVTENYIVITDGISVKCFDSNGEYRYNFGRIGRGRGEYVRIENISYDSGILYVFDQRSLLSYNVTTGDFINKIDFEAPFYKAFVSSGYIYGYEVATDRVICCYELNNPTKKKVLYKTGKKDATPYPSDLLCVSGGLILFIEPMSGIVYQLKNGQLNALLHYDMGEDSMPLKKLQKGADYRNYKDKAGFFTTPYFAQDYLTFGYTIGNEMRRCILNINSKNVCDYNIVKHKREFPIEPYFAPIYSDGNYFYQTRSAKIDKDYFDVIPNKYSTFKNLEKVQPEDNVIVCKIRMNNKFLQ